LSLVPQPWPKQILLQTQAPASQTGLLALATRLGQAGLRPRPARHEWRGRPALRSLTGAAILVSLLALLPLAFTSWAAIQTGWSTASTLIFRPRVGELLVSTTLLIALAVPACTVLGIALGWLTERSDLPGARLWAWLAVAPLAIPAFVHSYAWVSIIPGLHGLAAGVMISTLAYFPFLYLPIAAALHRLDPAIEDSAAALGLSPWRVFIRVVVPQLRLAICGGALLTALHLLAEYGLYGLIRFDTFTTAIMDQFQSTFNGPAAYMLANVLVVLCLALLASEAAARGDERYARVGPGAARMPRRSNLGRAAPFCLLLVAAITLLAVGVPLITLARWLLVGGAGIWRLDQIGAALGETVLLAGIGGILTTLAATPMAWLSIRAPSRLQRLLEATNYIVGSVPGVVTALGLVTIAISFAPFVYQTIVTIVAAYVVMFLPRALISMRASIAQAPVELEQAACSLGRSPMQALWAITVRLAAPGAAASFALVGLGITNELTATQMLAPNGIQTLAMAFWSFSTELDYAAAAPYAVIMVLFSLPLTSLLYMYSKPAASR
jgi:iron(III) transport system permease protein